MNRKKGGIQPRILNNKIKLFDKSKILEHLHWIEFPFWEDNFINKYNC